jgi:hypothetical protein
VPNFDAADDPPVLVDGALRHLFLSQVERLAKETQARAEGEGAHDGHLKLIAPASQRAASFSVSSLKFITRVVGRGPTGKRWASDLLLTKDTFLS